MKRFQPLGLFFSGFWLSTLSVVIGCSAQPVSAQVVESFEEIASGTSISKQSSDSGWLKSWSNSKEIVEDKSLRYEKGNVVIDGGHRALKISATGSASNDNLPLYRSFTEIKGPYVYLRFLLRIEGSLAGGSEFCSVYFTDHDPAPGRVIENSSFQVYHRRLKKDGPCLFALAAGVKSPQWSRVETAAGETYCVVVRLSSSNREESPTAYDTAALWINPDVAESAPAPNLVVRVPEQPVPLPSRLGIRYALRDGTDSTFWIDSIVIGDSWEQVMTSSK